MYYTLLSKFNLSSAMNGLITSSFEMTLRCIKVMAKTVERMNPPYDHNYQCFALDYQSLTGETSSIWTNLVSFLTYHLPQQSSLDYYQERRTKNTERQLQLVVMLMGQSAIHFLLLEALRAHAVSKEEMLLTKDSIRGTLKNQG